MKTSIVTIVISILFTAYSSAQIETDSYLAYLAVLDLNEVHVESIIGSDISDVSTSMQDTIQVGSSPSGIAASSDGRFIYVANQFAASLDVISTLSNTTVGSIPTGSFPIAVAVSPNNERVYVVNNSVNSVTVIDAITNSVVTTVSVGLSPVALTVTPDGESVYVVNEENNTVTVIQTSSNAIIDTIDLTDAPVDIVASPVGNNVYVLFGDVLENGNPVISIIDSSNNTVIDTFNFSIPLFLGDCGRSIAIAVSPDGEILYVTNGLIGDDPDLPPGCLSFISTSNNTSFLSVLTDIQPFDIALTPDGAFVLVSYAGGTNGGGVDIFNAAASTSDDAGNAGYGAGGAVAQGIAVVQLSSGGINPDNNTNSGGSCALTGPVNTNSAISNYLLILFPVIIGLFGMINRKRKRV